MEELLLLVVLTGMDLLYYFETFSYKKALFDKTGGPAIYPRVILVLLLISIAIRVIQILKRHEYEPSVLKGLVTGSRGVFLWAYIAYVLLMEPLGMIIDTVCYLIFICHYMIYARDGKLGSKTSILKHNVSFVLLTLGIYLFFTLVMNVAVPKGLLSSLEF